MDPIALGFAKQAGFRQLAGRALKGVGRAIGHSGLESKGFKMQHGAGSLVKTRSSISSLATKRRPAKPARRMGLVIPHDTPKVQADVMRGTSKARSVYTKGIGGR